MRRLLALAALLAVLLAAVPSASAHPIPQTTQPSILSYADPQLVSNRTTNYTLVANEPVTWACVACPSSSLLSGSPSIEAGLSISPTTSGSLVLSVEASSGSLHVWQNWTATVVTDPVITTTPAFNVPVGGNYRYVPAVANPASGSWTFSGAPYLALNSTTGTVFSTPGGASAGAFQNTLVYHSGSTNYTQSWWTTTGSLPATITVAGHLEAHFLNATLPTTDVAAVGADGIFLGAYPLVTFTDGTDSWAASWDGASNYSLVWHSGTDRSETLWWYATPGTTPPVLLNGAGIGNGAAPSSGFASFATPVVPEPPAGLAVAAAGTFNLNLTWANPPGGGLVNDTARAGLSCGSWAFTRSVGVAGAYVFAGLPPSATLCVSVAAWNASGQGFLAYTNGTTLAVPSATGLLGGANSSGVTLAWVIPHSITYTSELVELGTTCGQWSQTHSLVPPANSYTFPGLAGADRYCLAVVLTSGSYSAQPSYTNASAPVVPPVSGSAFPVVEDLWVSFAFSIGIGIVMYAAAERSAKRRAVAVVATTNHRRNGTQQPPLRRG